MHKRVYLIREVLFDKYMGRLSVYLNLYPRKAQHNNLCSLFKNVFNDAPQQLSNLKNAK